LFAEVCDVTDPAAVARFVAHVAEKFGGVDICVTNAGGPPAKGFLAASLDDWQSRRRSANFLSTVYFAREVIPHMQRNRWGRIITITSITTKQPVSDLVLSNAVRAAVVGLVKSLANEFGKDGILVNNVGPGFTATDRLKELAKARSAASGKSSRRFSIPGRRRAAQAPRRTARSCGNDRLAGLGARVLYYGPDRAGRWRHI
jgi:3-oxoacyl-[acyl-carrier protein] reductase